MFDSARFIYPEILLFWEGNRITKTMLQADFQAVLDGYAGISQYANKDICAAYVQLNAQHIIYASIFFTIRFDQEGFPEGSWNLPSVMSVKPIAAMHRLLNVRWKFVRQRRCLIKKAFPLLTPHICLLKKFLRGFYQLQV